MARSRRPILGRADLGRHPNALPRGRPDALPLKGTAPQLGPLRARTRRPVGRRRDPLGRQAPQSALSATRVAQYPGRPRKPTASGSSPRQSERYEAGRMTWFSMPATRPRPSVLVGSNESPRSDDSLCPSAGARYRLLSVVSEDDQGPRTRGARRARTPGPHARPSRGGPHRHSRSGQGPARMRLLMGRDRLPARHHPPGRQQRWGTS